MTIHFLYDGFTQDGDRRRFLFRGIQERNATSSFSIEVELPLLLQSRVPVQEGPMFCLQLLTLASSGGVDCLTKFHNYRVVAEDFRPLLVERARKAAEKASKKPFRRSFQKPSFQSNLNLGSHWRDQ
jgi:hypothetical protein